jgi:outer membrane immunogenic protein
MKKLFLSGVVFTALAVGPALAADLPRKAPAYMPPPPPFSWTGFYIGVNAGGAWADNDFTSTPNNAWLVAEGPAEVAFLSGLQSPSFGNSGFTGGGQIGYNWQVNQWVFGLEADIRWMDLSDSKTVGPVVGPFGNATVVNTSTKNEWVATFRPRLGYAWDRTLLYVTGGLAVGNVQASLNVIRPVTGYNSFGSVDDTQAGWTVGGGIEWAFAPHWSIKAEYLYVDLGDVNFTTASTNGLFPTFNESVSVSSKLNIATVGLNYRF